jgi:OOP family OmpA-OmpF porin
MRKLAIAVALSSTLLATPAFARDGAWYVGGEFGAMIVEDSDVQVGTVNSALRLRYRYGYDGDINVGYDLGSFRIEGEVAYKKARIKSVVNSIRLPGQGAAFAQSNISSGSQSALSFMLNGMLDFGDEAGISGFVGGGAGIARVKINNARIYSNQAPYLDDSDSRFAWQVFAGVRQAITDTIDVTVKYRFFNVPNVRMTAFNGQQTKMRFRSHSLLGGLTFNFGAAPPPPPPAPALPPPPPPLPPAPPPPAPPPPPPPPPCQAGPFMVFFDWDKSDITPQAAAILDNAAASYQNCGSAQVMIAGHTDRSGSDQYNQGLGQRRADAVRAYLAGRGIPDGVMTTQSFGESRPLVETADGVREPQNRRVEITYGQGMAH